MEQDTVDISSLQFSRVLTQDLNSQVSRPTSIAIVIAAQLPLAVGVIPRLATACGCRIDCQCRSRLGLRSRGLRGSCSTAGDR
jgi:hypothetical protein